MAKILGIIGGGQLGMMLTEAAKKMPEHISKVIVLDPNQNCSASLVGAEQIIADFKDRDAIIELSKKVDIITYEIESGDSDVLKSVENDAEVNPSPETLKIIQDKLLQKQFLSDNNIPVPKFIEINNMDDLKIGLEQFGFPALLKARRDAYDGKGNKAYCVPVRDVKKDDQIIVGEDGVKITPPERPREGVNVFEFMGSSSSSERPTQHIAKQVADDIFNTKKKGGKIIIVGGPAIVHTGADDSVSELIRLGYVDGVLAGNALAVHDIEYATLGTSLGMNVKDATLAYHGHRNHMDTINEVFKAGSIANMVKSKKLTKGIMYECIKNKIPFVLAGSIRDDGPLPDVITDVAEAQREYKKVLKGADMVIMISTMLHSIATGNMLPAAVKVIVVDISQPTVTKLMDRGTWQALGIVSDVGAFLPMVVQQIRKRSK